MLELHPLASELRSDAPSSFVRRSTVVSFMKAALALDGIILEGHYQIFPPKVSSNSFYFTVGVWEEIVDFKSYSNVVKKGGDNPDGCDRQAALGPSSNWTICANVSSGKGEKKGCLGFKVVTN